MSRLDGLGGQLAVTPAGGRAVWTPVSSGPGQTLDLLPPYAWLAQHRVARARVLLERGHSPAQAAMLTGFADQAHLTRWFRRVVGITPGAYRNSVQDSTRRPG